MDGCLLHERRRVCPGCGWPEKDCKCSSQRTANAQVPSRLLAKLRIEKKGRGGKTVTVVYDLPDNAAFLKARPAAQTHLHAAWRRADNTVGQGDLRSGCGSTW
jgi:DTW domain-containing protein YfiP